MKSQPPNQYRVLNLGPWSSTDSDGMNGAFRIPFGHGNKANCIVSDGGGMAEAGFDVWEHVSVHMEDRKGKQRTPTWDEMCQIKDTFWEKSEECVQFHPAEKDYVNIHPNVLHIWRKVTGFPQPPKMCV